MPVDTSGKLVIAPVGRHYGRAVAMSAETDRERARRRSQRTLFNGVAELYDATRPGHPAELIEFLVATADLGPGSAVLEVGCGTGQLTRDLAHRGFRLTAIDIGPAMITAARRGLDGSAVLLEVSSFEDFAGPQGGFDLIVSATAFHWIDPEVKFSKSARLLRPGGWLALLATGERYDDPIGAALHNMWVARSEGNARWAGRQLAPAADSIAGSGWFDQPVCRDHQQRTVMSADAVIGVENTRATSLSWPDDARQAFTEKLRDHLGSLAEVPLTLHTTLTMARVL
jgi:ubiquinone/menaquinone biosynthesis C-methylase UbiE